MDIFKFFTKEVEVPVEKIVEVVKQPEDLGLYFEIYKSKKNKKWYFRLKANNNKVIAGTRQGYENKVDCVQTVKLIQKGSAASAVSYK